VSVARNGSIELAYDVAGDGPNLLLIPGVASTRPIWNLVRPVLARRFRTIAFDLRDSGESTIAEGPYALTDLVADATAVMDAAGADRAHVLGHSLGGAIAQELALAFPGRVEELTLVSTWARGDLYTKNVVTLLQSLTANTPDDFSFLAALLYVGAGTTTLRDNDLTIMTAAALALGSLAPRAAIARQWDVAKTADTLDRIASLAMPVRVIWGTEDKLIPPWLGAQLAQAIPAARTMPIEGCGHLPMVAAPEAFVQCVAQA